MARKTVMVCDDCGAEVEDGKGAVQRVTFNDARRGRSRPTCATIAPERPLATRSPAAAASQRRSPLNSARKHYRAVTRSVVVVVARRCSVRQILQCVQSAFAHIYFRVGCRDLVACDWYPGHVGVAVGEYFEPGAHQPFAGLPRE